MQSEWRRIALEAAVLFLVGVTLGLTFNYGLVMDAFTGSLPAQAPQPATTKSDAGRRAYPAPVTLEGVRELLAQGAVAIDARSAELFAEGHLPGALSLPLAEVEARGSEVLGGIGRETTIVTYCSGYGCPDSFDLGVLLLGQGYRDVRVFEGGLPAWRDAGLPVQETMP